MNNELYYTYLDETKRTFFDEYLKQAEINRPDFFGIASVTFTQSEYIDSFEDKWSDFRKDYNVPNSEYMHFVEYKKLLNPTQREDSVVFDRFLNSDGEFDGNLVKGFFERLLDIINTSDFKIIFTERYRYKINIIDSNGNKTKEKTYFDPYYSQDYITFKRHLNNIMKFLVIDEDTSEINFKKAKQKYTKLRFDGDGNQFQAKSDLKLAYHHVLSLGTESFKSDIVVGALDEIRFIRKEEVGDIHSVSHAGLELIDFLCSTIASEERYLHFTNFDEYKGKLEPNNFFVLGDEQENKVDFSQIKEKIIISDIQLDEYFI